MSPLSARRRQHSQHPRSSAPRTTKRRQAKRNSLSDNLMVAAKTVADLKIEKTAVDGERRVVEAESRPVQYLATLPL